MNEPLVIVGTGLAGYTLAREFRKLDETTPLILISADDGEFYSKPVLSTGFGKGKDADALVTASAERMAGQLGAQVLVRREVTRLEPQARRIWLGDQALDYRDLVLALGAQPLAAPVGGEAGDAIFAVNDLDDYRRLQQAIRGPSRILIMGAGLIGCEFANDLASAGHRVEVVSPSRHLMPGLLPEEVAGAVQGALEDLGVRFHFGAVLEYLQRQGDGLQARLSDGRSLACDLVLSAVGLRPRTGLAQAARLAVARGIVVDRWLRASQPNIHALGDCAEVDGHSLLYVMPLMSAARALARTLAGEPTAVSYGVMPVTVKTPACSLIVAPPASGAAGQWQVEGSGTDRRALYLDGEGRLLGYALAGQATQERQALSRQLPPLMAD
ncbi:FAD-dependent oxidoreductase [Stutzerimonas kirkiae]|uniref:FAD-dependent oxidoreductase n=1 Tax=Stutzerimonas kirkiae TaxID=2211392 RepID=A0A4V2KCV5_9GAMM|nr:FAD-dependent oxidoreductase [Stutzerimonas kirkiae]TBU96498.1 FAD-dependent oxidoreductase [Stutzerimonas kirkiae]TBV04942.1 FAD-dependent oxidoreductase [Stutzerimonas kirkiae]